MRWSVVRIIWLREVRDQLRDRRTLFMLVALPLLLYPLLGLAMAYMSSLFAGQALTIGVAGYELIRRNEAFPPLVDESGQRLVASLFLDAEDRNQFNILFGTTDELDDKLKQEKIQVYLRFDDAFVAAVREGRRIPIDVRLKDGQLLEALKPTSSGVHSLPRLSTDNDRSRLAYERLRPVLREWEREIVKRRMTALGKPRDYGQPIILPLVQEKTEEVWSKIFPFLIVMMSLTGALYPAIDVCAGEKERGTMETLLISPAGRSEIVLGKFLTVWVFSAATALLNLGSLGVTAWQFSSIFNASSALVGTTGGLPAPGAAALLWCIVLLVPLGAFFSAICLALAVYARSSKEGQYYLMPLMVGTMLLTVFSVLPGVELTPLLSMLPVTGAALLLQALMAATSPDQLPWLYLAPVLLPLGAYCYLALHWAIVQFNREEVLFREAERLDLGLWLRRLFREKEPLPSPAMAMACFFILLMVRWLLISYGAHLPQLVLLAVLQIAGVLTPTILMAILLTASPRLTLRLRWPSFEQASEDSFFRRTAASRGVGLTAWLFMGGVLALAMHAPLVALLEIMVNQFPGLEEQLKNLKHLVRNIIGPQTPLLSQLLVLALLPAICEELMFRGFILSGLAGRLGIRKAIIVSSILFAFAHMSAFQFVPTLVLGLILGILATRSGSLLPGMVFHMIHNGLVVLAANTEFHLEEHWAKLFSGDALYSRPVIVAGLLIAGAVLIALYRLPSRALLDSQAEPTERSP